MRVVLIGQQAFGKAVLEAFLARGDTVAAVFCAPEKEERADPLREAGEAAGIATHMFPKLTSPEALAAVREAAADLGVMAYVTQFVSQEFCAVPRLGTIQFHPSLLPAHRGASSMSWSIMLGRRRTGFSIFRPTDGLDEGPVLLQRAVRIEAEDTLGSVYFGKIFPLGVAGLLETADRLAAGHAAATAQYEPDAGYEGIIGEAETEIHWHQHVEIVHNLVRGVDPAPGAWTNVEGRRLYLFDAAKLVTRTFAEMKGRRIGEVVACGPAGLAVQAQGGVIVAGRVRWEGGKKVAADEAGVSVGVRLGG